MKASWARSCSPWKIDPPRKPKIRSRSGGARTSAWTTVSRTPGATASRTIEAGVEVALARAVGPAVLGRRAVLGEHRRDAAGAVGERRVDGRGHLDLDVRRGGRAAEDGGLVPRALEVVDRRAEREAGAHERRLLAGVDPRVRG